MRLGGGGLTHLDAEQIDLGLLPAVGLVVLEEGHRERALLEHDAERRVRLGAHLVAKALELLLPNHARVAEPTAVRLDSAIRKLLGLVRLVKDVALGVALRPLLVHVQPADRRRTSLRVGARLEPVRAVRVLRMLGLKAGRGRSPRCLGLLHALTLASLTAGRQATRLAMLE